MSGQFYLRLQGRVYFCYEFHVPATEANSVRLNEDVKYLTTDGN